MLTDIRHAFRALLKTPGFTVIAVLTLTLGIGATAAIFSVVNTVLLQPLPYAHPEQLARIYTEFSGFPNDGGRRFWVSKPEYLFLRRETRSWASLQAWSNSGVNLAATAQPLRATASFVTGGLLRTLGAIPALGRNLSDQDDAPGAPPVATISYGLWQRVFGGERAIVGREILLNGRKCTIVGVMSREFRFPPGELDASDVWTPLQIDSAHPGDPTNHTLSVLGRLAGKVLGLVLGSGLLLTSLGIVIGLAGAFALTRVLAGLLFGVTPTDPLTFVTVAFLLTAVATFASYIPARRATRVDPLVALRAQ